MSRAVTERDLRMPEFRDVKPEELEFRADGKIVRKDRFEIGMHNIAWMFFSRDYEIPEVVQRVAFVAGIAECALQVVGDDIWATLQAGGAL